MDTEKKQYKTGSTSEKLCLLAILILAAGLRMIRLGTFPFWADEAFNLVISEDLYGVFFQGNFVCNHPPMPYLLLALWRMLGLGINEWTIRALPAVFGIAGVAAIYWLGKQLFSVRIGLTAAFILAIAPFHVLHSQDLKEYIYLPFFATIMMGFFYRGLINNLWKDWLLYGLLAGICCYTEIFIIPLLLTINIWFLFFVFTRRQYFKKWFVANTLGALLFLPWAGIMLHKVQTYMLKADNWWVPHPTLWSVAFYFKTIAYGYMAACKPCFYLAFLLFVVVAAWGSICAIKKNHIAGALLVSWAIAPVVIVFLLSYISQSIFLIRAMIPYSIAVYLLVAIGLSSVRNKRLYAAGLSVLVLLCCVGLITYYARILPPTQHPHRPGIHPPRAYDQAAHYILENLEEGDVVVHASQNTWLPFYWYGFQGIPQYVGGMHQDFVNSIISGNPITTKDPELLRLWPKVIDEIVPGHKRVWYVFCEWERFYLPGNAMHVWYWLDSRFSEIEKHRVNGIDLFLYSTPENENMPIKVERDKDTGVTCSIQYAGWEKTYEKTVPDSGLLPAPIDDRKGALVLGFENSDKLGVNEKDGMREIGCYIENTIGTSIPCRMYMLASDVLVPCTSFDRISPEDMTWHIERMYNHNPPPVDYNMPVFVGDLRQGARTAYGKAELPAGNYIPYIFMTSPCNTYEHWLAPVDITIGSINFQVTPHYKYKFPGKWNWVQGNPIAVEKTDELPIRITTTPLAEDRPGYVNLGYIAFVNQSQNRDATLLLQDNVIPEKKKLIFKIKIPSVSKRIDIWFFEHKENGQSYYIYKKFGIE